MSKRVAILISGRGSNMQSIVAASKERELGGSIDLVISNRPGAKGLQIAEAANIKSIVIDHQRYASREDFDSDLADALVGIEPDLVVLAGFMRILTPKFVKTFEGRLINIHPSLLPDYPGLDTHQRALKNGDSYAGATVHYVTDSLDGGPAILQGKVPIDTDDNVESLANKVLKIEHQIYPIAIAWHLSERITILNNRVRLNGTPLPRTGYKWEDLT